MDGLNAIPSDRRRRKKNGPPSPAAKVWSRLWPKLAHYWAYAVLLATVFGAGFLFKRCYYQENAVYLVRPQEIRITGNSTLTRELLLQIFGLTEPVNGFELVCSDIVPRLQREMPILKNVQMTYEPGRSLELWVEERMPLARLAGTSRPPLVVDDEGVVFMYPRPTGGYPEIGGFDLLDLTEPGARLPDTLACMLHLLTAASEPANRLPSGIVKVALLGTDSDDGLLVTLADGRKINIAWEGMARERGISEGMVRRLHNVTKALRDPVSEGRIHFNAMAPDRVTASE